MTEQQWHYRVGFDFTGGPTHPAGSLPGDPPRWTDEGSSGCDIRRNAPLTVDGWAALGADLAHQYGYATVTITSAVELSADGEVLR
jgi:hypothetical protein